MSTISKLLGRSPFGLLQRHMDQVAKCMAKMEESLECSGASELGRCRKACRRGVETGAPSRSD